MLILFIMLDQVYMQLKKSEKYLVSGLNMASKMKVVKL